MLYWCIKLKYWMYLEDMLIWYEDLVRYVEKREIWLDVVNGYFFKNWNNYILYVKIN